MSELPQVADAEEISLFELFEILWEGKWWLTGFVALALVLAGAFLVFKDSVYESKLIYSSEKLPYFLGSGEAYADFRQILFSESVFNDWKKTNRKTVIPFEYISVTEMMDGFIITKDEHEQFVTLGSDKDSLKRDRSFVLVKSVKPDSLQTADYVYLYMQHINALLTARYLQMAKDALVIIEARFKDNSAINDSMVNNNFINDSVLNNTLSINRYIKSIEEGAQAFTIEHPTKPKNPTSAVLVLVSSVIVSGIIGVFYIFLRNAIGRYKAQTGMAA